MKVQAKGNTTFLAYDGDDSGEGLAIFLSQGPKDVTRWLVEVFAKSDHGQIFVGKFYTSPPNVSLNASVQSRCVAMATCPGAKTWALQVTAADGPAPAVQETADFELFSSKSWPGPPGVSRVGQRYGYHAAAGGVYLVLPGQVVTSISGIATGAGLISIGSSGDGIRVPTGSGFEMQPKAEIPPGTTIYFSSVDWIVEYLESA